MAQVGTNDGPGGNRRLYVGDDTLVGSGNIILETNDVSDLDTFTIMSVVGSFDVDVSLNGTDFNTASLSLTDLGAITSVPVLVGVAARVYGFAGPFKIIRIRQNGATGLTGLAMFGKKTSR